MRFLVLFTVVLLAVPAFGQPVGKADGKATSLFFDNDASVAARLQNKKGVQPDRRIDMTFRSAIAVWKPKVKFLDVYIFPKKPKSKDVPGLLKVLKDRPRVRKSELAFTHLGFQYHVKRFKTGKLNEAGPKFIVSVNDGKGNGHEMGCKVRGDKASKLSNFRFKLNKKPDEHGQVGTLSLSFEADAELPAQERKCKLRLRGIPVYETRLAGAYE